MKVIRFAVFTDLHYEHIHDDKRRVRNFADLSKDRELGMGDRWNGRSILPRISSMK